MGPEGSSHGRRGDRGPVDRLRHHPHGSLEPGAEAEARGRARPPCRLDRFPTRDPGPGRGGRGFGHGPALPDPGVVDLGVLPRRATPTPHSRLVLLARFPEGEYTCDVKFVEGAPKKAIEEDELTHCLPDGPVITDPGVLPADTDWTVMWDAVTTQYDQDGPGLGDPLDECDAEDELVKYSVTVEFENGVEKVMDFDVSSSTTTAVVSGDFLECGLEGKVEIGAFVESGNSTFREIEIATTDCP